MHEREGIVSRSEATVLQLQRETADNRRAGHSTRSGSQVPAMKIVIALLLGAAIGAVVACGGAAKSAGMAPATGPQPPGAMDSAASPQRQRIDELDKQIDDAFTELAIARPAAPPVTPDMQPAAAIVKPTADPTCKAGTSQTCTDTCKLADSICENAGKICEIAAELGDDAYAKGKCGSGRASCDTARERCCGCT
jgi:hypothetical protein